MHKPQYTEAEVAAALGGPVTCLGSGAFGETWRRADTAVKIIVDGSYPQDRLRREVDGLRRVSSPHVVRLLDTRAITLRGEQRRALVFEYISGGDVADRISAGQLPPVAEGGGVPAGRAAWSVRMSSSGVGAVRDGVGCSGEAWTRSRHCQSRTIARAGLVQERRVCRANRPGCRATITAPLPARGRGGRFL